MQSKPQHIFKSCKCKANKVGIDHFNMVKLPCADHPNDFALAIDLIHYSFPSEIIAFLNFPLRKLVFKTGFFFSIGTYT